MPSLPRDLRLPRILRLVGQLRLWWEAALIGLGYWVYGIVANAAPRHAHAAVVHGGEVLRAERLLHIDGELAVNHWWATSRERIMVGNVYYDVMHFAVPAAVLFFLFVRRSERYLLLRRTLLAASLAGLAVFWLWPDAPPRLLPHAGFVDTIARIQTFGAGGAHGMTASENPFAAMPSLHVTWALWAAAGVWAITRRLGLRLAALAHVLVTVFVVVATGNHLFLDAVGGVGALAVGFAVATAIGMVPRRRRLAAQPQSL